MKGREEAWIDRKEAKEYRVVRTGRDEGGQRKGEA